MWNRRAKIPIRTDLNGLAPPPEPPLFDTWGSVHHTPPKRSYLCVGSFGYFQFHPSPDSSFCVQRRFVNACDKRPRPASSWGSIPRYAVSSTADPPRTEGGVSFKKSRTDSLWKQHFGAVFKFVKEPVSQRFLLRFDSSSSNFSFSSFLLKGASICKYQCTLSTATP